MKKEVLKATEILNQLGYNISLPPINPIDIAIALGIHNVFFSDFKEYNSLKARQ